MKIIRNSQIQRILLGVPLGHTHIRALIELNDGTKLVFHEAALAGIVRALLTIKLDPLRDAIELTNKELANRRAGFAKHQLIATEKAPEVVRKEISQILYPK